MEKITLLLQHLPDREEEAIHMRALASLMGISERTLRKIVSTARNMDIPVLSGNGGYWYSTDPAGQAEIIFTRKRRKAADSTLASIKCFEDRQQAAEQDESR